MAILILTKNQKLSTNVPQKVLDGVKLLPELRKQIDNAETVYQCKKLINQLNEIADEIRCFLISTKRNIEVAADLPEIMKFGFYSEYYGTQYTYVCRLIQDACDKRDFFEHLDDIADEIIAELEEDGEEDEGFDYDETEAWIDRHFFD